MNARRLVVFSLVALAGCATVTRGTTNQVQITSEPSGANVRTSIGHACVSPCTLTVDRKSEFIVTFSLDGYQDVSIPVRTQVAGAGAAGVAGNVLVGGIVGVGVDAATGASLEHAPNPVHAVLQRAPTGRPGPAAVRR
jgi:hypothetical protein